MSQTNIAVELRTIVDFFTSEAPALKVTAEMIKTPTADNILRLYYFLCDLIFDFEGREIFDSKNEVYGRALMIIRVFDFLSGLFTDILDGEGDFNYTDLLLPEPSKTRYFLVQLIRFYNFKCDRQREVDMVANELDERRRDVEAERVFESNTQSQLERERETQEGVRKKKLELTTRSNELEKEFKNIQAQRDDLKREFESKKQRSETQRKKIEELQSAITEAEEKSKRLEMNIVSSPDRIVSDIENMEKELQDLNRKQTQVAQDCRKLERDLGNQSVSKQIVDHFVDELKQLEHFQDELSEYRRVEDQKAQDLKDVEVKALAMEQQLAEMQAENETKLRQLADKQQTDERSIGLLIQEKGHLESDLKELSVRVKKAKEEMRTTQQHLKKKEKDLTTIGEKFDAAVEKLKEQHELIQNKVDREEKIVQDTLKKAAVCTGTQNFQ
uniref:Kinetochore protein Nuf2 N-terminal domain-containing protein n=1 Tax=Ditylenchus dipsaci TaxID=166011 RepID=A0A915D8L6_9BILA